MSSVKVIDLNEEAKEEQPPPEPIEEATEPVIDTAKENIEEPKEEQPEQLVEAPIPEPEHKPKARPNAKPKANDIVNCEKCSKSMTYKNLRYSHNCEPKPVKKQANPKGIAKPKPIPQPIYEEEDEEQPEHEVSCSSREQVKFKLVKPPPVATVSALTQHYQLLQQQYMKQKQEKYNNLCSNMFKTKPKKR